MTTLNSKPHQIHCLTPKPPLGWNSYDCYGCAASAETLLMNLEAMATKLKPFGYQYFVVDNGWFGEYTLEPGQKYPLPKEKHAADVRLDEYGRYQPSQCYFPNGMKSIIDRCHELGLKFGIHIMRGISRKAVSMNLPIFGTSYRASDIANVEDTCKWCHYNYGVDMDKPGAQPFYDAWIQQLADWGVDLIKADDITGFPQEIEAIAKAIEKSGREMVLSLSPGGQTSMERMDAYLHANMLRTTTDIWDNRADLNKAFEAWETYNDVRIPGFWLDMDMIPFGHLQIWNPKSGLSDSDEDDGNVELSGKGNERMSGLSRNQKYTFITMRALAASPLFMGGDLLTSDEFSFELITNREMLACNQNGVSGRLVYRQDGIDAWVVASVEHPSSGWIGIFNRNERSHHVELPISALSLGGRGILSETISFSPVWDEPDFNNKGAEIKAEIGENGVLFLKYIY